jgi:RimJ/RimL family protein N-acetyltransferase
MAAQSNQRIEVVRTHLELSDLTALRRAPAPDDSVRLVRRRDLDPQQYRELYLAVGERWHWRDRLSWTNDELAFYLSLPDVHVFTLHLGDETAGFFELQRHQDARVEIMYFGLVSAFIGRGLGGWMLTRAVEEAFALRARRVVLNTCTLDAPQALPNYLARGFVIVREESYPVEIGVGLRGQ